MDTYEFIVSVSWIVMAFGSISLGAYLVLSGRLKWLHYDSIVGKIGLEVTESLGIKDLTSDEIIAFESFVYRDTQRIERGARLAYILLFIEKDLLLAQFEDNILQISLTEKGNQVHATIIAECEKRLMITPETEITWKVAEKKSLKTIEKKLVARMKKQGAKAAMSEEPLLENINESS
jgi:hypothetical protein